MAQAISIPNTSSTRRKALTALATLAGAAAVVTPAVAAQVVTQEDPIFALIEAHRTLEYERGKILRGERDDWDCDVCVEASEAAWAAHAAVLATPPTTLAGVAAVLAYAGGPYVENDIGDRSTVFEVASTEAPEQSPLGKAGRNFLSMIGATVERLS